MFNRYGEQSLASDSFKFKTRYEASERNKAVTKHGYISIRKNVNSFLFYSVKKIWCKRAYVFGFIGFLSVAGLFNSPDSIVTGYGRLRI